MLNFFLIVSGAAVFAVVFAVLLIIVLEVFFASPHPAQPGEAAQPETREVVHAA